MSEVTARWIPVSSSRVGGANRVYQRVEVYSTPLDPVTTAAASAPASPFVSAQFGGNILTVQEGVVVIQKASGKPFSKWLWKSGRIVKCGWSTNEEAVFVTDTGNVLVYDMFGELKKNFSMGQEAKDLKVISARVFQTQHATGVAVLTSSRRFFVVNNIQEPRVRKMSDVDLPQAVVAAAAATGAGQHGGLVWGVLTADRHAKLIVSIGDGQVVVVSQTDTQTLHVDAGGGDRGSIAKIAVSWSGEHICVYYDSGFVWLGSVDRRYCVAALAGGGHKEIAWCSDEAVVVFSRETASMTIVTVDGDTEAFYFADFINFVQELDGVRVFSLSGQEFVQQVPQCLIETFSIGSVSPGSLLRLAAEEFFCKSHKSDEYLRMIEGDDKMDQAVADCIQCAAHVYNPEHEKELLRAAQFGKSFISGGSSVNSDTFAKMCLTLRVLNALRVYNVGIPITISQYEFLTPEVVVDRLLCRRLYPLAMKVCQLLKLPAPSGENRVLAHWACYKVGASSGGDWQNVAREITKRLGHHPQISYCDIAAKAAECGKKELSIRLLDSEIRISKQVPLLVQLGQVSTALQKSTLSGNRDLAFSVILHLRTALSSSEFHILIRKFPLGKILYLNYCKQHDIDGLEDWFVQEDDFLNLAKLHFAEAYKSSRGDIRTARLVNSRENWERCHNQPFKKLTDENHRLLKCQTALEDKLGQTFTGMALKQTVDNLLSLGELKHAEKLKSDFEMNETTFAWLRVKAMARNRGDA